MKRQIKFRGGAILLSRGVYRPFIEVGAIHRVGDRWGCCEPEKGIFLPLCASEREAMEAAAAHYQAEIVL